MTNTNTLAAQHADSLLKTIRESVAAGTPFGCYKAGEGWAATMPENAEKGWEEQPAAEYLSDALDIKYLVSSDRTYRSARILVSFGGPNVWIDTRTCELEVHWGDSVTRALPREFVDPIDEALAEYWEMGL